MSPTVRLLARAPDAAMSVRVMAPANHSSYSFDRVPAAMKVSHGMFSYSPNRRAYRGTPCYPADPAWVRPGRLEPYAEPDGDAVGEVAFDHDGSEHRLVAWGEDDGSLWILFRDATSGVTTYPALRQLEAAPPSPDGSVEIDFNRAYNMPCAYTEFATCPLPPPANTLPFPVEAGEQIPLLG